MNFGEALKALKEGKKVARSVWGGYWYLAEKVIIQHNPVLYPKDVVGTFNWCSLDKLIIAVLKDNQGIAAAQPYQEDILSEDWLIVD